MKDRIFNVPGAWNLKKCTNRSCGLVWLDPVPLRDDILHVYRDYYTHSGERRAKPPSFLRRLAKFWDRSYISRKYGSRDYKRSLWRKFFGLYRVLHPIRRASLDFDAMYIEVLEGGRLLEVGCGAGDNLKALQGLGWKVEGVDFDPKAVENARRKGLKVRQGNLEEHNYPDNVFDAIVLSHLIEHLHDPFLLLKECKRILSPEGTLVVITPNVSSLGHKFFKDAWYPLEPPRHLYIFSLQTLSSLSSRAGFNKQNIFTTVRQANGVFTASWDINRSGRHIWGGAQPRTVKKLVKAMALIEWSCLAFFPFIGEEIVLVAKK
jgi:2-polyprenyl-3-methyl-5-hydroxy-6-metoxy-1,4-benzoquinol methylase